MLTVAIDLHRNILSAQCCIKFEGQDDSINKIQLLCEKSSLSLSLMRMDESKHSIRILTPANFFILTSVSKSTTSFDTIQSVKRDIHYENDSVIILQKSNDSKSQKIDNEIKESVAQENLPNNASIELSVRFQVSTSDYISIHSSNEMLSSSLINFFKLEIIPNEIYKIICTNCGTLISSDYISFQCVKEHCNTDSELSESWFCHKKNSLQAVTDFRNDVLHVDDAFVYLHSSIFNALNFTRHRGSFYWCQNCNSLISSESKVQPLMCIYADALMFIKTDSDQYDYKSYHLKLVLLSLWSMISQKITASKLFLQCKEEDEDICILIWVPPTKVAQFKFQTTIDDMPPEVNFSTEEVYKVQYYVGTLTSPPIQKWKKDFCVDFYKVRYHFIKTVREILTSSSKWIPRELETNLMSETNSMSNFSTGYIPASLKSVH